MKSRKAGSNTAASSASRTLSNCMKVFSMRSLLPCHFSSVGLTFFTMCFRHRTPRIYGARFRLREYDL